MPEGTIMYVFQDDNGKWLATVDEAEAQRYVACGFHNPGIESMTLGDLYARDAHALVRVRQQYYWAEDLMTGTVRGALN
jgi:hypothetical protein